ncbi:MAG TPA: hypothetical protein VKG92_09290, partial [Flavobacteriales bacterium]|nr:hypothetical protein [Flavobacteriales bacterium]
MKHRRPGTSKCAKGSLLALCALASLVLRAQPQSLLIDRVIAVVGREAILHSELVVKVEQAK